MHEDPGIPLAALVGDAVVLDAETFADRYGHAFLVRSSVDGALQTPPTVGAQEWFRPTAEVLGTSAVAPPREGDQPGGAGAHFFAYPLRARRPRQDGSITIGRVPGCDIYIPDASVSKLHAVAVAGPGGVFLLTDRGSRNGTHIGEQRLPPGQPTEVQFGKTIRFGRRRFTLLPAGQLVDLVRSL